jgi:hypothetical protein
LSQNSIQKPAKELDKTLLRVARISSIELVLLGLSFVFGMILNLFVAIPSNGSLSGIPVSSVAVLVIHIAVAFGLIIVALALLVIAAVSKKRAVISSSLLVVAGVGVAFAAGLVFLYDGQDNVYSFIMALGFLVSTIGVQRVRALAEK